MYNEKRMKVQLEPDSPDCAGQTTLFFREESLQGRLDVGDRYGCDLCVDLGLLTTKDEGIPKGTRRKIAAKCCE